MSTQYAFANYLFDIHTGLQCAGKRVHLPPKERGLLQLLLQARGQVVRKDELLIQVWGLAEASDESISRTVYRLRNAMHSAGGIDVVETVYNSGFRIRVPVRASRVMESSALSSITQSSQPDAVAALLSAREYLARRSPEDVEAATNAARQAITLDPAFAAAWALLADIRVFQAERCLRPPREAGWLARQAAESALAIDPDLSPALSLRGWVQAMIEQDVATGLQDLDRALAGDPDYWGVYYLRAWVLQAARRKNESVAMVQRAMELNPLGHTINAALAYFQMLAGDMDAALQNARELAHRFATIDSAQATASAVCSAQGLHEEAIAYAVRARELAPHTPSLHAALASALARAGRAEESRAVLQSIEQSKYPPPSADLASAYLALGDRATAIQCVIDAGERGLPQFAWTQDDPRLADLGKEPLVAGAWNKLWPGQALAA